jgi:hypothetical protein
MLEPDEVLRRIAAIEPGGSGDADDVYRIEVGPASGGSVIVDIAGYAGIMRDVVRELSRGTVLATVQRNINFHARFLYAADGEVITGLDPMFADEPRWGTQSDRLLDDLGDLGMVDEFDDEDDDEDWNDDGFVERDTRAALALAERCTGVRLEIDHVRGPLRAASVAHLYNRHDGQAPALAY